MSSGDVLDAGPARVLSLSAAALVVLVAEPLYLLVDTAVVGRLGALPLGALAVGAVVLAQVSSLGTFLAYGTTARAARAFGAGRRDRAIAEGVAATWLALLAGLAVVVVGQLIARPVAEVLGNGGPLADEAVSWMRIALCGAPGILVAMAGNGWMRGVRSTRAPVVVVLAGNGASALVCPFLVHGIGAWEGLGLEGSAIANVGAQTVVLLLFGAALVREAAALRVPLRPVPADLRAQLGLGRDLLLRSLAFQACFLSATAVTARFGAASVAAHQVVLQLWVFMSTVLDSLAIAAQQLVGAALGASSRSAARVVTGRVTRYGLVLGVVAGVVFAALAGVLPRVFSPDPTVLATVPDAWWFFVALQPIAGFVFALDGVLLGAADAAFLRRLTLGSAVVGFLPMIWGSLVFGWGLAGVWAGLSLFMLGRAVGVGLRARGDRWMVPGGI